MSAVFPPLPPAVPLPDPSREREDVETWRSPVGSVEVEGRDAGWRRDGALEEEEGFKGLAEVGMRGVWTAVESGWMSIGAVGVVGVATPLMLNSPG